jgi:hypothetical protein
MDGTQGRRFSVDYQRVEADHFRRVQKIQRLPRIFKFDKGCVFQWGDYFP